MGRRYRLVILTASCIAAYWWMIERGGLGPSPERVGAALVIGAPEVPRLLAPLSLVEGQSQLTLVGMLYEPLYEETVDKADSLDWRPTLARDFPSPIDESLMSFDVRLSRESHWHDGRAFGAEDVVYSWRALVDVRNDFADRVLLRSLIRGVTSVASDRVRVSFTRAVSPADVIRLLSFPIMSSRFGGRFSPLVIHPDSARANPLLTKFLRNPVGTGPYHVAHALEPDATSLLLRGRIPGRDVVWRLLPDSASQRTAVSAREIDVLLDADTSVTLVRGAFSRRLESTEPKRVVLVLNPNSPTLSSVERRQRVVELLRNARSEVRDSASCSPARRLPASMFRVIALQSVGALWRVEDRLRSIVACGSSSLRLLPRRGGVAPFGSRDVDGVLVALGDRGGDIAPIMEGLGQIASGVSYRSLAVFERWRASPRRSVRDSLRNEVLKELGAEAMLVELSVQRLGVLLSGRVRGVEIRPERGLVGAESWRW